MKIQSLKLVYFSPTGTTEKFVNSIAKGIKINTKSCYNLTNPKQRDTEIIAKENELLIVATPVYMGRVPAIIKECLTNIKANKTPVVFTAVYGNRTYGNALLELKDILVEAGCIPLAGATFIGEHSFSSSELPIAKSRPTINDLRHAENFGKKIITKLNAIQSTKDISKINIPGNTPYGGITKLWSVDFIAISDKCKNHGLCAEVCPTGAINFENTRLIDIEKCISCCACIKNCPENARTIKKGKVKDAAIRLNSLFKEPKNLELFIE
ncbi:MAG: EFR1 family ferrodoxin [Bacteroidales bacterium]|nr:EFR1 family ferrodoxin [Bacteroidales bacterium]